MIREFYISARNTGIRDHTISPVILYEYYNEFNKCSSCCLEADEFEVYFHRFLAMHPGITSPICKKVYDYMDKKFGVSQLSDEGGKLIMVY